MYIHIHTTSTKYTSGRKSCMKTTRRVTFNKVVGVNRGRSKKLKRVNATNLAYDILRSRSIRGLVKKHKQHGSTRKAIKEIIRTLHKLDMRLCRSSIGTIGAIKISTLRGALACGRSKGCTSSSEIALRLL